MRVKVWLRILGVIFTVLFSANLILADMPAVADSKSKIKLEKIDGQVRVHNGYDFELVLLIIRTDSTDKCSCLEWPPLFLPPQEKEILDFLVSRSHLLAFYRWGFNQPVCILTQDNIEVVKAIP